MFDIRQTKAEIIEAASRQNDALIAAYLEANRLRDEIERLRAEVAEWKQAASVEAGLCREFLARAEKAENSLNIHKPIGGGET